MRTNLKSYLSTVGKRFDQRTLRYACFETALDLYNCLNFSITSRYPIGTNIFSEDWNLAVVLDACRVDLMQAVADEYPFIEEVDSILSVGSSSHEWTTQTFRREHAGTLQRTAFLSANPFSRRTLVDGETPPYDGELPVKSFAWNPVTSDTLGYYEQVSNEGTDLDITLPPWKMTDRVISIGREGDFSRVAAHYFQPHRPFLGTTDDPMAESEVTYDRPMRMYDRGELTREELWNAQLDCLRAVLDCVEVLISNFDADRVIITADHGQLLGEFGVTGHPGGLPFPHVKCVPWIETTATDEGSYTPRAEQSRDAGITEGRLEKLGYI